MMQTMDSKEQARWAKYYSSMDTPKVNHALHIVLSILTAGFWLPIYAIILIVNGSKAKRTPAVPPMPR